jgi:hypothetical protein
MAADHVPINASECIIIKASGSSRVKKLNLVGKLKVRVKANIRPSVTNEAACTGCRTC